ncbi:hypothetical protein [Streptomyces sp. NPDC057382]|uniref:hypothetical protein n=1 Tax=unclassified Streptomyces TaxID=2593676 RepID=UPI00363E70A1
MAHQPSPREKPWPWIRRLIRSDVNFPLLFWLKSRGPLLFIALCAVVFIATAIMTSFKRLFESALGFTSPYAAGLCGADLVMACIAATMGWLLIPAFVGAVAGIIATSQVSRLYNRPRPEV